MSLEHSWSPSSIGKITSRQFGLTPCFRWWTTLLLVSLCVCWSDAIEALSADEPMEGDRTENLELLGYWPFSKDFEDHSPLKHKTLARGIRLSEKLHTTSEPRGAYFDGKSAYVEISDSPEWKLRNEPFSISMWAHLDEDYGDSLGDLISCYDASTRRGFHLGIYNHGGVTNSQPNSRQLHFGIDQAQIESEFKDHGRLGDAVFIFSLCVHNHQLYASTCHAKEDQTGRVFRWEGNDRWKDLGCPTSANAISALAVYNGSLYAASAKYRLAGSSLAESENAALGGDVYRLNEQDVWEHCGNVSSETEAIAALVVFRGKLYASSLYRPAGFFRYEGGNDWVACETPGGKRIEAMTVHNDELYATCYDEGVVFKYDGEKWKTVGIIPEATQTYGFGVYRGELYVSEWPNAHVYRYRSELDWIDAGRLGQELEAMPLLIYNGKMYGGTLPSAEIYRYDEDSIWQRVGRVDHTPDVKYRRAWSMAVFQGRLFVGTLPSGRVLSIEAGKNVTWDREISKGWHHIAAVKSSNALKLYVDGNLVSTSPKFQAEAFDLDCKAPLQIGFGAQDYFRGRLAEVRLYRGELTAEQIRKQAVPPR